MVLGVPVQPGAHAGVQGMQASIQCLKTTGLSLQSIDHVQTAAGAVIILEPSSVSTVFKDLLEPVIVAENREVWDPAIFDVIPALFPIGNDVRYDDFPDPGVDLSDAKVIPEPATGLMVCFGLMLLAWSGRRRSLQRQPITS